MAQLRELINNLSTGKISKNLRERFDIQAYRSACTTLKNFMPLLEGGVRRRPGSVLHRNFGVITTSGVSFDFNFDADEAYTVYLTQGASGCLITDQDGVASTVNFTLGSVPWAAFTDTQMEEINFTQSGDVMVIVHQNFLPVVLTRSSLTVFDLDDLAFENRPFYKHGQYNGTIRILSLTAGATTCEFPFTVPASWQGMRFKYLDGVITINSTGATTVNVTLDRDLPSHYLLGINFSNDHKSELASLVPGEDLVISGGDAPSTTGKWLGLSAGAGMFVSNTELKAKGSYDLVGQSSGALVSLRPTLQVAWSGALNDNEDIAAPNGRILINKHELFSGTTYNSYVDDTTGTFASGAVLTATETTRTHTLAGSLDSVLFSWGVVATTTLYIPDVLWTEEAWSGYAGYPSAAAFHQDRLWLGGSAITPNVIGASQIGAPFDFDIGSGLDDEAMVAALRGDQVPRIHHLHSSDNLVVLTDRSEGYIPTATAAVTPSTVRHLVQTRYGSSLSVRPVQLGGTILFVQNDRRTIRQLVWEDAKARYTAALLSTFIREDLNDIRQMAAIPAGPTGSEEFVFVVNGDGTMMCFIGSENDNISGFFPWTLDGFGLDAGYRTVNRVGNDLIMGARAFVFGGSPIFVNLKMDETKTMDWAVQVTAASPSAVWEGSAVATSAPNYTDHPYSQAWEDIGVLNLALSVVGMATDQDWSGEIPAYYLGDFSMHDTNTITLPTAHKTIEYGVSFTAEAVPTPWLIELDNGVKNVDPYSVVRAVVSVAESLDLKINGNQALTNKANLVNLDQSKVWTVDGYRTVWGNGWAVNGQITLENSLPLPCTILSIMVEVEF